MPEPLLRLSDAQINNLDVPKWPSLYNPVIEVGQGGFRSPVQPGGSYLQQTNDQINDLDLLDIFRFTLYWSLIFHIPFNLLAGTYAFFNFLFPPTRPTSDFHLLSPSPIHLSSSAPPQEWTKPPRLNARRSRVTFALLVLLTFLGLSLVSAVVGAAVVGFVLAGVYKAGGFYMSTWIPFIWAVIQGLVALLGLVLHVVKLRSCTCPVPSCYSVHADK
ncbi:hypothetical protein BS17DRAFT_797897 [Gyrodon lividus]|nr:hypothetical protein BS17DRAFT_797897 [Gyrodon lividus]